MNESFFRTHSPWSYLASTGNGPNIFCHKKCHTRVNCDPWATKTAPKITDNMMLVSWHAVSDCGCGEMTMVKIRDDPSKTLIRTTIIILIG